MSRICWLDLKAYEMLNCHFENFHIFSFSFDSHKRNTKYLHISHLKITFCVSYMHCTIHFITQNADTHNQHPCKIRIVCRCYWPSAFVIAYTKTMKYYEITSETNILIIFSVFFCFLLYVLKPCYCYTQ